MRNSLFPGEVDREWLAYLAECPPLRYVLAQHICTEALDDYQAGDCQIIYIVHIPGWVLQWVQDDAYDVWDDVPTFEAIFGSDCAGLMIQYCPFCGEHLPELGEETCLDVWHGRRPITMRAVGQMMRSEESSCT